MNLILDMQQGGYGGVTTFLYAGFGDIKSSTDIVSYRIETLTVNTLISIKLIYLGFYVGFNTVQVISRRVVGRPEETST